MPLDQVVSNIIYAIRNSVPKGWGKNKFTWKIKCNYCLDKEGVNLTYECCLPSDKAIKNAYAKNDFVSESICPKCKKKNYLNILCLLPSEPPNEVKMI